MAEGRPTSVGGIGGGIKAKKRKKVHKGVATGSRGGTHGYHSGPLRGGTVKRKKNPDPTWT